MDTHLNIHRPATVWNGHNSKGLPTEKAQKSWLQHFMNSYFSCEVFYCHYSNMSASFKVTVKNMLISVVISYMYSTIKTCTNHANTSVT